MQVLRRNRTYGFAEEKDVVTRAAQTALIPRFIRLRDAPRYLGMDNNRFNSEVRPHVPAIRIGTQGIAFDRIDLDAWADQRKSATGVLRQKGVSHGTKHQQTNVRTPHAWRSLAHR